MPAVVLRRDAAGFAPSVLFGAAAALNAVRQAPGSKGFQSSGRMMPVVCFGNGWAVATSCWVDYSSSSAFLSLPSSEYAPFVTKVLAATLAGRRTSV